MSYPRYEIFKDSAGEFRFHLVSTNYKIILASEGYTAKQGCQTGISSCQRNSPYDGLYKRLLSTNGKRYFNLIAENNQVIGTSQMYDSAEGMEVGIAAVKKDGSTRNIFDKTVVNA